MIATPARSRHFAHDHSSSHSRLVPHFKALLAEGWRSFVGQRAIEIRMGSCSVTGPIRKRNEDRCVADIDNGLCLVADGVGGHDGGAEASAILARIVPNWLVGTTRCGWCDGDIIESALADAVECARQTMIDVAESKPDFRQMGATMAFTACVDNTLYVSRVGDCRVYLLRRGSLYRLTNDQSFVQAAIDAGVLTEETAATHPLRHLVTNTVGVKPLDEAITVDEFDVLAGDRVLLCSDGLTDVVGDNELADLLTMGLSPQETADALIATALGNHARDNITCVVADLCNCEAADKSVYERTTLNVA